LLAGDVKNSRQHIQQPYQTNSGSLRYKGGNGVTINGNTINASIVQPGPLVGLSNVSSNGITISTYIDGDGNEVKNISETLPITSTSSTGIVTVSGGVISIPDSGIGGSVYKLGNKLYGFETNVGNSGNFYSAEGGLAKYFYVSGTGVISNYLCVNPGPGLSIDSVTRAVKSNYSLLSAYISSNIPAASYATGGTFNSGVGVYYPTYYTAMDTFGLGFVQGAKGLKAPKNGYYNVSYNFQNGGTSGATLIGYYDAGNYYSKFAGGDETRGSGSLDFYVPYNAEIYIYVYTGNVTKVVGDPMAGSSTVTGVFPTSNFSISFLSSYT